MSPPTTTDSAIRRRVIIGTAANFGTRAITMVTWFLLTPFLLRQLGTAHYGLWVLVGSFVAYGSLLNFGMSGALTKFVAEYQARGDLVQGRAVVATSLWLYLGLGLTALGLSVTIAPISSLLFRVRPEDQALVQMLFLVMGVNVGVSIPGAAAGSVLMGLQRYDLLNGVALAGTLLSALATVAVLLLGGGVVGMVAVNIAVTLILQLPSILLIRRIAPELGFGLRGARRDVARQVLSFSSALFISDVAGRLQTKTDELVIGALLAVSAVTPYAIARKLSEAAQLVTESFLKVLLPLASQLHAVDDRTRLRALYLTSTRLTLAIFLPIACVLVILADRVLEIWVGAEFSPYAPLVVILTLASLVNVSQWPAVNILKGMGKARLPALTAISNGVINVGLSLILLRSYGLIGVALGTLIPMMLECLFVLTPYTLYVTGIKPGVAVRQVLAPALLPALPALVVLLVLRRLLAVESLLMLVLVAGLGGLTYALGYLALSRGVERQLMVDVGRRVARLVAPWRA